MVEVKRDGVVYCYSKDNCALPHLDSGEIDAQAIKSMMASGYKFFIDGKQLTQKWLSEISG